MRYITESQVEAQNIVNKLSNEIVPQLQEASIKFIGEKIGKVDGDLTKKFSKEIDVVLAKYRGSNLEGYNQGYAKVHYISVRQEYSTLVFKLSCVFRCTDKSCIYRTFDAYIGKMALDGANETGVLKGVYEREPAIMYDYEEQQSIIKQIDQAEKLVRDLKYKQIREN